MEIIDGEGNLWTDDSGSSEFPWRTVRTASDFNRGYARSLEWIEELFGTAVVWED